MIVTAKVSLSTKMRAFLKGGSQIVIQIDENESGEAFVELKDGIDPKFASTLIGKADLRFDFDKEDPARVIVPKNNFPTEKYEKIPEERSEERYEESPIPADHEYQDMRERVGDSYSPGQGVVNIFSNTANLPSAASNIAVTGEANREPVLANMVGNIPQTPVLSERAVQQPQAPVQPPQQIQQQSPVQQEARKQHAMTQTELEQDGEYVVPPQETIEESDVRMTLQEFYQYLGGYEAALPGDTENILSRNKAVVYDQSMMKYRPHKPLFLYNNTGGPFVVDDLDLRFMPKQVMNVSGLPASMLRNSGQLRSCFDENHLILVSKPEAKKLIAIFKKHEEKVHNSGLEVYDLDGVAEAIDKERYQDDEPDNYNPLVDEDEGMYLENLTGSSNKVDVKTETSDEDGKKITRRSY